MVTALALASFAAIAVLAGKILHLLVKRRLLVSRRRAGRWLEGAVLFACVGLPLYTYTFFVDFGKSTRELCAVAAGRPQAAYTGLAESYFPRSMTCQWTDGTTSELVPVWLNPVIFGCVAGVLACAVLAAILNRETSDV